MLAFSGTETNKQIKAEVKNFITKQFQFIVLQAKDVLVRNIAIRRNFVKQHSKAKGNFELLYHKKISCVLHFYRGIVCHTARVLTTLCHLLYCTSS